MKIPESCAFCETANLHERTIRETDLIVSFVSRPWFREGHCLVIPKRHVVQPGELKIEEAGEIMLELGRLSCVLDQGYGTGIMQKYQPLQAENNVKVSHLHFHTFPRLENETALFPVPEPNDFSGFMVPSEEEISTLVRNLH